MSQNQILQSLNNPFRNSALIGLTVIFISGWMLIVGRPTSTSIDMPLGYSTPIYALEFALNSVQIDDLIESLDVSDKQALVISIWLDMVFLVAYNLFLFFVLRTIAIIINKPVFRKLSVLPLIIMLADVSENIQLLHIMSGEDYSLITLQFSTWLKWLLLSYVVLQIGRFLMTTGRVYDRILGLACFVPLPVGIIAYFSPGIMNELFGGIFFLLFPMLIIYTWFSGINKTQVNV